jgi:hypothetical protein
MIFFNSSLDEMKEDIKITETKIKVANKIALSKQMSHILLLEYGRNVKQLNKST